ncbi:uncharacterized protein N7496_005683 [Penicillium cataractarum]|uniref:Major facilitator superfamily (MFS) profile domain-containing protein n=1 Tax=Penicillium cataractarum TaxID=2100454 RepID=A0A9W9SJ74_9EURO|nr:uncharacterized protein N7496_005683 [Penicillium cataractarum]KAJ5378274.1 hypothetical protein N7496_005683 [Penicillium cataractarum]
MITLKFVKGKPLYRLMSWCCCIAFGLYGYDAGVLGGVQETKPFLDALGNPTGAYIIPLVASSYTLAATVCSLLVSLIGMPVGRRGCILLGDILVVVGGILQATSWSVAQIILGRVICGFGIGFISCAVPTYMAEMSIEIKKRGPEVAVQCIFLIGGCAVAYWVDFGFTRMNNQLSWRLPIALQSLFALVSGSFMFLLPDTPRWYYARARHEEGDDVLSRLHDRPLSHPAVQHMRHEILDSLKLEEEQTNQFRVLDLFWDRSNLKTGRRIRIAFMILALQQMMGINISVYYATIIISQAGVSPFLAQLLAAVMTTVFALGATLLPSTIERVGRRAVLIYSAAAMTVCLAIFVAMIGSSNPTLAKQWTAIAFIFIYNFIFGYGWIGVCWLYGPEIAPLKYRHVAGAASAFGEWLFSFITVFAGGIGLQTVGWKMWIWCVLSCAVAVVFVYFMCPETTGKSLEEIDLIFKSDSDEMPGAIASEDTVTSEKIHNNELFYSGLLREPLASGPRYSVLNIAHNYRLAFPSLEKNIAVSKESRALSATVSSRVPFTMVRHSSAAPSLTPGGQTTLGSSIYPAEYIWNSLSDSQRDSFISTVFASLVAGDGQRKRPRIDLTTEEDADHGRVPSLVLPILPRFPGLDRAAIIAVFEHTFRPKKDLIKLRSPEFKVSALDGESFDLKSTSSGLQLR